MAAQGCFNSWASYQRTRRRNKLRKKPEAKNLRGNFKKGEKLSLQSPYILLWHKRVQKDDEKYEFWQVYESDSQKEGFIKVPDDANSVVLPGSTNLPEEYDNRKVWFETRKGYIGLPREDKKNHIILGKNRFIHTNSKFICSIVEKSMFGKVSQWYNDGKRIVGVRFYSELPKTAIEAKWKRFFQIPSGAYEVTTLNYKSPLVSLEMQCDGVLEERQVIGPYFDKKEHEGLIRTL